MREVLVKTEDEKTLMKIEKKAQKKKIEEDKKFKSSIKHEVPMEKKGIYDLLLFKIDP